jgi:hypothetical protein
MGHQCFHMFWLYSTCSDSGIEANDVLMMFCSLFFLFFFFFSVWDV